MPDSPAKKPVVDKANSKLMLSALSSEQGLWFVSAFHQTGPDTKLKLDNEVQCYTKVKKVSATQLAHPKVDQPKPGASSLALMDNAPFDTNARQSG